MIAPAFLSDEEYSLTFASETPRTNYLRGGLSVGTAYDDNALPSSGKAVNDVRYSIWPSLALQQSRSRLSWSLAYSPGYTFHQRLSSINGLDHNLALGFEYRLRPHVILTVANSFRKTSDLLSLPSQSGAASGSGGIHGPNDSIIPPATTTIGNFSNAEIAYQFAENAMIGARGAWTGLWYQDRAKVSGLFDSTGEAGSVFYAHRLSRKHYIGVTSGFQRFLTHPGQSETQTQSTLLFYTLYLPPSWTVSLFAGPEHSDNRAGSSFNLSRWSAAEGGSLAWHGQRTSFGASYAHRIRDGGGLSGAVLSSQADASVRWQSARALTATLGGSYSTNSVLASEPVLGVGGKTWSGSASLQHPVGDHLAVEMGYTHLHQSYSSVPSISNAPDQNYAWVSFSYQFNRPLGR
jgi:hypothetical protein